MKTKTEYEIRSPTLILPQICTLYIPLHFFKMFQDPAPKCRAAALGVVGALLEGSRGILAIAAGEMETPQTTSYVSFSASLAASVRELHKQLLAASSKEQSTLALVQLLKVS